MLFKEAVSCSIAHRSAPLTSCHGALAAAKTNCKRGGSAARPPEATSGTRQPGTETPGEHRHLRQPRGRSLRRSGGAVRGEQQAATGEGWSRAACLSKTRLLNSLEKAHYIWGLTGRTSRQNRATTAHTRTPKCRADSQQNAQLARKQRGSSACKRVAAFLTR